MPNQENRQSFLSGLAAEEHRWLLEDLRLRRQAQRFAAKHQRDPEDIYRTLKNMQRTPEHRLALGLRHARLHPDKR